LKSIIDKLCFEEMSNPEWDGRNSNFSVGIDGIAPNGLFLCEFQ
jgi:hypothetical protein